MFRVGRQVFQVGQAPSGPTIIRPLVVTTGAVRRAKLQSNCHYQQTNAQLSWLPFLSPNQQCRSTCAVNKATPLRSLNVYYKWNDVGWYIYLLHCALAAAQCIVIGPVCVCVGLWLCLWVCYHDNLELLASILTKLGLYVKVVTISSWLNFGRPTPGKGSVVGWKFWLCLTTATPLEASALGVKTPAPNGNGTTASAQCLRLLWALLNLTFSAVIVLRVLADTFLSQLYRCAQLSV